MTENSAIYNIANSHKLSFTNNVKIYKKMLLEDWTADWCIHEIEHNCMCVFMCNVCVCR